MSKDERDRIVGKMIDEVRAIGRYLTMARDIMINIEKGKVEKTKVGREEVKDLDARQEEENGYRKRPLYFLDFPRIE